MGIYVNNSTYLYWHIHVMGVYRLIPVRARIGPLHDPVTWYGINYAGTQATQWDF